VSWAHRLRNVTVQRWFLRQWRTYRSQLRFCIRVTIAAISALLIARLFALPLHGLWVVLTATVVIRDPSSTSRVNNGAPNAFSSALSGCPLSGVKRTPPEHALMSAF